MQDHKEYQKKEPIVIDAKFKGLKSLRGKTLAERFKLGRIIAEGSQGKIFECKDLETGANVVAKLST